MRRRSRASSKPANARSRKAKTPKRRDAADVRHHSSATASELGLARLTRERDEALERETATSEVLKVIRASPGELEPVFQAMLENATRICEAKFGLLFLVEGDAYCTAALHNVPAAFVEARHRRPIVGMSGDSALARVARTKRAVQVADVAQNPAYQTDPQRLTFVTLTGARTTIAVPMLKDNDLIGTIAIYRQEVRPFTDKQIALLENFAAQAVMNCAR